MNVKYLFILQFFQLFIQFGNSNPKYVLDVAQIGLKAVQTIVAVTSAVSHHVNQREIKVLLEQLRVSTRQIESTVKMQAQRIIDELSTEINMQRVHNFKTAVDDISLRYDEEFYKYFMTNTTYERETIDRFVNDRDVFKQLRRSIKYHTVPTNVIPAVKDDRLFEILNDYLRRESNNNRLCELKISHYKVLYQAYCTAVLAVVKASVMVSYSYKYLQQGNSDAWKAELEDVEKDYIWTVYNISNAARATMARSSRAVTRCNPSAYVRGVNYMNYSFRSLYISFPNILGLGRNVFLTPEQRSEAFCDGVVSNCVSTRVIRACLAPPESGRRYKAIIERGGIFDFNWYYKGPTIRENECERDPMIGQVRQGNNGACICSEPSTLKKNAFLNKTAVYSDIANNRIITGIRFRTRWAVTYLEIQEGEIVNGTVVPESVRWRDDVTRQLEEYERRNYVLPDDFNLGKDSRYIHIPDDLIEPNFNVVNLGNSNVKFELDDVVLPAGMVVTGVKFDYFYDGSISLMVAGTTAFNEFGGFELSSERRWFSDHNSIRNQLNLDDCDDPLRGPEQNKELSKPGNSSVAFQLSEWNRDGSQSLIPFMDLQEVVTDPPSPIGGIGIFYKGQQHYGGFISLKIFDIDDTIFMFNYYFWLKSLFQRLTG